MHYIPTPFGCALVISYLCSIGGTRMYIGLVGLHKIRMYSSIG